LIVSGKARGSVANLLLDPLDLPHLVGSEAIGAGLLGFQVKKHTRRIVLTVFGPGSHAVDNVPEQFAHD
jgi:hypothetical protein